MRSIVGIGFFICLLVVATRAQGIILEPERFDQWGDLRIKDENARLDKVSVKAKEWALSIVYLVVHAGKTACVGEARTRGVRARKYLVDRGVSFDRIVFMDAGWREEVDVEVWILPPELGKPKVSSEFNLKPRAVKLEKNCKMKYRGG